MISLKAPAATATSQNVTLPLIRELFQPNYLETLLPSVSPLSLQADAPRVSDVSTNPMMDALKKSAHYTLTENMSPAYNSTLSPVLDLFQGLTRYATTKVIYRYLEDAWREDPELSLRIIWNARSIHDGKGERGVFYIAWGWLYNNHPRTAIQNLSMLINRVCMSGKEDKGSASHGYWKDLLNLLTLAVQGRFTSNYNPQDATSFVRRVSGRDGGNERVKVSRSPESIVEEQEKAKKARKVAFEEAHVNLVQRLADSRLRALFIAVARLFADQLAKDLHILEELERLPEGFDRLPLLHQLSLAGKWAPTAHGSHDKITSISTAVAMLLHQHQIASILSISSPMQSELSVDETHVLRSFYQRWVLRPLRNALALPEPLMSSNRWGEIKYNRAASVCMKNNMEHFFSHDKDRFMSYLMSVKSGKQKISGATLLPHELIKEAFIQRNLLSFEGDSTALKSVQEELARMKLRVTEAQWETLVERLRESGALESSLAICDVSGSMGTAGFAMKSKVVMPIYPALALSLITARLAKPPFSNGFVTFSLRPEFVELDPTRGLLDTLDHMVKSHWDMNTNLHAVFVDLLLPLAVKNNVKKDDMIKRLFIFSDMQFDCAQSSTRSASEWNTNHDEIVKAYKAVGYEVPEIVYWDLSWTGPRSGIPVTHDMKGVALMNGFSASMLKVFMGEQETEDPEWEDIGKEEGPKEAIDPMSTMMKAVMKKSFDGLVVVD